MRKMMIMPSILRRFSAFIPLLFSAFAFFNEVPFEFINPEDLVHVTIKLQQYLKDVDILKLNQEERRYVDQAKKLYDTLEPKAQSILKRYGLDKVADALLGKQFLSEFAYASRR